MRRTTWRSRSAGRAGRAIGPGDRAYLTIARFLHFFLIGFLLDDVYLTDWRERPPRTALWDLVWAGEITNDTFGPLRVARRASAKRSARGRPHPGDAARARTFPR